MKLLFHRVMGIHIWTKVSEERAPSTSVRIFILRQKAEFPLAVAAGTLASLTAANL